MFKAKKALRKFFKIGKTVACQIDQRSIRCWIKSKLQSALILQRFLRFSPQLPLNQLNNRAGEKKLKKNTQVTSKIISFTHDVKQQLQFVYCSHLLIFKVMNLIVFNSHVISTCELVNQDIKKLIFAYMRQMISLHHRTNPRHSCVHTNVMGLFCDAG